MNDDFATVKTSAPKEAASSAVPSVDDESITKTRGFNGDFRTPGKAFGKCDFEAYVGMTTPIEGRQTSVLFMMFFRGEICFERSNGRKEKPFSTLHDP